ncbi:MAG TPA: HEPN domain-containing protein [Solirubrobacterales bacterium]|nr:HEPN domain-containing protein [Solirubrobacterales bacterium]
MARSSPGAEDIEVAALLAKRAAGDLKVAEKLAPDLGIDDNSIGFHTQQAVEKALKVALVLAGIDFPRSHDLEYLLRIADQTSIDIPDVLYSSGWLTPWATEFRYDDEPIGDLDRDKSLALAEAAVTWCTYVLQESRRSPSAGPAST